MVAQSRSWNSKISVVEKGISLPSFKRGGETKGGRQEREMGREIMKATSWLKIEINYEVSIILDQSLLE